MKKIIIIIIVFLNIVLVNFSCNKDFLDNNLEQTDDSKQTDITSVEMLQSFMYGAYDRMRNVAYYGRDFIVFGEIRSDEMYSSGASGRFLDPSQYSMVSTDGYARNTWQAIYKTIANCNIVINTDVNNLTYGQSIDPKEIQNVANSIKAQAYAVRALAYFDLIKYYGQRFITTQNNIKLGVPIVLQYEPEKMIKPSRNTLDECYQQIESDLDNALNNIKTNYYKGKTELGLQAIQGLASRYYLWKGDYNKAYNYSKLALQNNYINYIISSQLYVVSWGLPSTNNSIFEIAYGTVGNLGTNSLPYIYSSSGYANTRLLTSSYNSFNSNDIRINSNIISNRRFIENKFYQQGTRVNGESNYKFIRGEELILNQIEAAFNGAGTVQEALNLINILRNQRGLSNLTTITINDIKNERKWELIGEGFRYNDLLRWGDPIPKYNNLGVQTGTIISGNVLNDYVLAFPIPQIEIDANKNIQQNPGY